MNAKYYKKLDKKFSSSLPLPVARTSKIGHSFSVFFSNRGQSWILPCKKTQNWLLDVAKWVQIVHLHPSIFGSRCIAPFLVAIRDLRAFFMLVTLLWGRKKHHLLLFWVKIGLRTTDWLHHCRTAAQTAGSQLLSCTFCSLACSCLRVFGNCLEVSFQTSNIFSHMSVKS